MKFKLDMLSPHGVRVSNYPEECMRRLKIPILLLLLLWISTQAQAQRKKADEKLAVVNGIDVLRDEVDEDVKFQIFDLENRIYELRKTILDRIITKILVESEAKARGMTAEAFHQELMTGQTVSIDAASIEKAFLDNAAAFTGTNEFEAKQRLRLDLEAKAKLKNYRQMIDQLRVKAKVEVFLKQPLSPKLSIALTGPSKGNNDAAITLIEFSDFQCPYCKQAAKNLSEISSEYGDRVKLVFKHLPLSIHPQAYAAAQAAYCAGKQNKFWQYHDRLFEFGEFDDKTLSHHAEALELNAHQFTACLASDASKNAVLADMAEAKRANIQSTPSFVVNGRLVRITKGFEDVKNAIDAELNAPKDQAQK